MIKTEAAVKEVFRMHYQMHRRGAFEFPEEEEWVEENFQLFKRNHPKFFK